MNISELKIEISDEVLESLASKSIKHGKERCGILMGSEIDDGVYRINYISQSCALKKGNSTFSCIRDAKMTNKIVCEIFELSNHTRCYIGEWHTHPEDIPIPSEIDKQSIKAIFKKNKLTFKFVIMCIIGLKSNYFSIYNGRRFYQFVPECK